MASLPAALLQYAIAEGEQEQPAAEAASQASPEAHTAPLQARASALAFDLLLAPESEPQIE
jgi:hypothetical protein